MAIARSASTPEASPRRFGKNSLIVAFQSCAYGLNWENKFHFHAALQYLPSLTELKIQEDEMLQVMRRLGRFAANEMQIAAARRKLERLDDYLLADIGVERGRIGHVVRGR